MLQNELFLIAIAILPGLIYVSIYYNLDKHKKEPIGLILKAFFWGAALVLPIGIFQTFIPDEGISENFLLQLLYMILIVGFSEELGKWLVTRFFSYRNFNFDELTDGLVYGASAGAGFAVFENIFYVLENGFETAILRAVLSVPGHIFWGSISGYWLGKFKFQNIAVLPMLVYGLGVSILAHGLFNTFLSFGETIVFAPLVVFYTGWLTKKYFKEAIKHDLENIHSIQVVETRADVIIESAETQETYSYSKKSIAVRSTSPRLKKILKNALSFFGFCFFVFGSLLIVYSAENYSENKALSEIFIEDGIAILVVMTISAILLLYSYKLKKNLEFNHSEMMRIQRSSLVRGLFKTLAAFCLLFGIIFMILIFTSELGDSGHSSNVFILFYLCFFAFYFFKLGRIPKISINENRTAL
ncbi:MAG: PrsW family glutamic-type intramembrane protease [Leptospiraceae bacterium]|nr:PrsW family glutamic-type intramembrane protease [Leptospiraceae bacterium]